MKYLETYRNWQIYVIPEAYVSMDGDHEMTGLTDRYVAVDPETHSCIDDVKLGSVKAGVEEALRNR